MLAIIRSDADEVVVYKSLSSGKAFGLSNASCYLQYDLNDSHCGMRMTHAI